MAEELPPHPPASEARPPPVPVVAAPPVPMAAGAPAEAGSPLLPVACTPFAAAAAVAAALEALVEDALMDAEGAEACGAVGTPHASALDERTAFARAGAGLAAVAVGARGGGEGGGEGCSGERCSASAERWWEEADAAAAAAGNGQWEGCERVGEWTSAARERKGGGEEGNCGAHGGGELGGEWISAQSGSARGR